MGRRSLRGLIEEGGVYSIHRLADMYMSCSKCSIHMTAKI
jgi:hypothetical protein